MEECRSYRDKSWETYSLYVHGYLLPTFDQMRSEGKLKRNTKLIDLDDYGELYDYEGELDEEGNACGYGTLSLNDGIHEETYRGTFWND